MSLILKALAAIPRAMKTKTNANNGSCDSSPTAEELSVSLEPPGTEAEDWTQGAPSKGG